jgi:hypothetical protein
MFCDSVKASPKDLVSFTLSLPKYLISKGKKIQESFLQEMKRIRMDG